MDPIPHREAKERARIVEVETWVRTTLLCDSEEGLAARSVDLDVPPPSARRKTSFRESAAPVEQGKLRMESADYACTRLMRVGYTTVDAWGRRVRQEWWSGKSATAEMTLPRGAEEIRISFQTQAGLPVWAVDRCNGWKPRRDPTNGLPLPEVIELPKGDGVVAVFRLAGRRRQCYIRRAWDFGRAQRGSQPPANWEWWGERGGNKQSDAALDELAPDGSLLSPASTTVSAAPPPTPRVGDCVVRVGTWEVSVIKNLVNNRKGVGFKVKGPSGKVTVCQASDILTPRAALQVMGGEETRGREELEELARARFESLEACWRVVVAPGFSGTLRPALDGPVTEPATAAGQLVSLTHFGSPAASPPPMTEDMFSCIGSDDEEEDGADGVLVTMRVAEKLRHRDPTRAMPSSPKPTSPQVAPPPEMPPRSTSCPPEALQGLGADITPSTAARCEKMQRWNFLSSAEAVEELRGGAALFACAAGACSSLSETELGLIATYQDLTAFKDEGKENGLLPFDVRSPRDRDSHIAILSKAMYLLQPGVDIASLTPESYADFDYQRNIAPKGVRVHRRINDRDGKPYEGRDTFCVTKPVIPLVFSVTLQLRASLLSSRLLEELAPLADGVPISRGLLLERTKQDRGHDATKRAKQLLLYSSLQDGGTLVTHISFSAFTSLPVFARKLVSKLADAGRQETEEVVTRLREVHGIATGARGAAGSRA
eukprot:Hpha_TRINITY_DN11547_c0_g1::TRINITY_DN11547_c0_g1_i1::g.32139::m.32139